MCSRHFTFASILLTLTIVITTGCASKPTETVLADSFFSGQALLDANGNGQIDSEDTPIANATFIVALQGGGEFGDNTDEAGNAFVTVPGGVEYPVTVRMEAPKDGTLKLVEPSTITLPEATGEAAKFLFSSK